MKKNIKYLILGLLIISIFTSCDNDATNGILSNIVNSEEKTTYEINAVTRASDDTKYYSVESDGIYSTLTSDNGRTKILDTSNYQNVKSIYFDDTNIYFVSNNGLHYFNAITDPLGATSDINTDGTLYSLTSNGYVIAKDTNYYVHKITGTLDISENVIFGDSTDDLATSVSVGTGLIMQTINYNENDDTYTFDYFYTADGTSVVPLLTDQDNKIVAAVNMGGDLYCVLDDASLIKIDYTTTPLSPSKVELYNNSNDNYSFNHESQSMFIDNKFLITFDSSNYVLLYDVTDTVTDSGFVSLTEGFANVIRNTSDVVGLFEVTADSKYYVATNINGYYTLNITNSTDLDDDDSTYSSCVSDFE